MSEIERAWAAGLFDGEGSTYVSKTTVRERLQMRVRMALSMTDEFVVRRFMNAMGLGRIVILQPRGKCKKIQWRWQISAQADIAIVISILWPYLSEPKHSQISRARQARKEWEETKPACRNNGWKYCKRGHLMSRTRHRQPGGITFCRICRYETRRVRRLAKLAS